MNVGHVQFIKRALVILFIGCGSYVGYHLWDGIRSRSAAATDVVIEPENPTSREVELEQLDSEGRTAWTLRAAESVGQTESSQLFRDVEIRFNAGAEETPVVVTADDCEIGANSSVHLEGNVVVRDDTTLRLDAQTLEYARFPDRVWTRDPVHYEKEGLDGDAGSMTYIIRRGELDLDGGVRMTFQEDTSPVRVTSDKAIMRRDWNWVQYIDRVRVRQDTRTLRANDLKLHLNETNEELTRVEAHENVDLRMRVRPDAESGEATDNPDDAPMVLTSEPGLKRLVTDDLEMLFRPGGEHLERVRAVDGGQLFMRLPTEATTGYDKRLRGKTLAFEFNEDGQLTMLRGRGGVRLVLIPRGAQGGERKLVTARQLESDFDPESGELVETRCIRMVEFTQGSVRASAERGVFRTDDSLLELTESPRLWDPRANLEAETIEIDIETGNVEGFVDVRSSSLDDSGGAGLFPSADAEPVYFVAHHLAYDRATDVALYTGAARGFQGRNRIEAETIQIHQSTGDLVAEGNVRTVFLQKLLDDASASAAPKPTVTRASSLHYRATGEVLEYRESVNMRSDEMTLEGASIDVSLQSGGGGVREILAEGDVKVETTDGKAAGDNARYLPEDESMTISGDGAWLENAGKLTEGKQLTFFLTDDRILVDGREQNRTKTTYTSNPRPF